MEERKPLTLRQVKQACAVWNAKGSLRNALGNVVLRPGEDGKPDVVWVAKEFSKPH